VRAAALRLGLGEGRRSDGDDLLRVGRADGGDRVAGIDRPREAAVRFDRKRIGNLHHIQQCRHPRGYILARRGRRSDEAVIAGHQFRDDRSYTLGQPVRQMGRIGDMDGFYTLNAGGRFGDSSHVRSGDDQVHISQLRARGNGGQCRFLDLTLFMLDENKRLHPTTPAVRSRSISSSTLCSFTPASRFEGSRTEMVVRRGVMSTP
jgi:hypothetical protein